MPIYEYQCDAPKCGHTFESFQKVSDAPVDVCPECNGTEVRKLISASSFHLKGSGWYQTDIARKEKAAKVANASGGKSAAGAKAESKPAPEKVSTPSPT